MVHGRVRRIDQDHERFRRIVKKSIKEERSKYISRDKLIVTKGKKTFSKNIPYIDIPNFRYCRKQVG